MQNFAKLREVDYDDVDKTPCACRLLEEDYHGIGIEFSRAKRNIAAGVLDDSSQPA